MGVLKGGKPGPVVAMRADGDKTAIHSPTFVADEAGIPLGVNLMANIILDYQTRHAGKR